MRLLGLQKRRLTRHESVAVVNKTYQQRCSSVLAKEESNEKRSPGQSSTGVNSICNENVSMIETIKSDKSDTMTEHVHKAARRNEHARADDRVILEHTIA